MPEIIDMLNNFRFYSSLSRNTDDLTKFTYQSLLSQYHTELPTVFSQVASYVLDSPQHKIPLFRQGVASEFTFKKSALLYVACSMALGLVPRQEYDESYKLRGNFSYTLDFSQLFRNENYQTSCVVEYLKKAIA